MLEVQTWELDKLIPYDRNPRKNDHAVDKVAAAIKEYGFRVPIVAKSDGLIVDGHLRWKAATKLGLKEVPVIIADDLTETQIKAFRISVNKMADLAEWDMDLLSIELQDLKALDFDLELTGFDSSELDELLGLEQEEEEEEEEEEEAEPASEPGKQTNKITFEISHEQQDLIEEAIKLAQEFPLFDPAGVNENSNGNALYYICEFFKNRLED